MHIDYVHLHYSRYRQSATSSVGRSSSCSPTWRFLLYLGHLHSTISRIALRNRKCLALVVTLILLLGAFVFAPREARADQQQPTVVHQVSMKSSEEYSGPTYQEVAKPAAQAPSGMSYTVETTLPTMPSPRGSTLKPTLKPTPEPAPDLLPKSALNPTPESRLQAGSASEKPGSELLEEPTLPVQTAPDPVGSEPTLLASVPSPEPLPEPVSLEEVSEALLLQSTERLAAAMPQDLGPALLPDDATVNSAPQIGISSQNSDYNTVALGPNSPISLAGGSPSTATLGANELNVVSNPLQYLQNSTTSVVAENLGTLAGDSYEQPSPNDNREPSESLPQPAPLHTPLMGDSSFALSGGGQAGAGGVVPLLLFVLASGLVLLRASGRLSQVFCEIPKPSSALLMPLERPG